MDPFHYRADELYAEDVPLHAIAAAHGTPCYVYSRAALESQWHAFDTALAARPHRICFAVKANANLAVLNLLARLGSGFDIVSGGELERVLAAGGVPHSILFSGVGKRRDELRRALQVGIGCFNVESLPELERLNQEAGHLGQRAPIALRVNPDVDAGTHPYIATGLRENKFGLAIETALATYRYAAGLPHVRVCGIDCHIGSQLTTTGPFLDALGRVLNLAQQLTAEGIPIEHLDLGGGLGIRYTDETPPAPAEYVAALNARLGTLPYTIFLEPGRAIVGNAGVLLTKVEYLKETPQKRFAIVDAAMNDLLRPALYQAVQDIVPVSLHQDRPAHLWDVVGPVCETGDFLGKARLLALAEADLLAIRGSGAYGFTMSSNYNSRPRAAEVIVAGAQMYRVRERETIAQLLATEHLLP